MKQKFFNKGLKFLKEHRLTDKKIILAVSGGLDSMVMLDLFRELSRACRLKLYVAHIHHGPSSKKALLNYRNKARQFVKKQAQAYGLEFLSPSPSPKLLKSEEDMRNFRHQHLKKFLKQKKADGIALAHNKEDLLETRLLNLIRGGGLQALKSMPLWQAPHLRLLREWSRKDIQKYARQKKLQWLEDPSNSETQHFRNWMRNEWLASLEKKRAGALQSLSRSLEAIGQTEQKEIFEHALGPKGIKRKLFMELALSDQKRLLALYMRKLKLSNYGQSHIMEILKLTDRTEKNFSAKILKKTWFFSPEYICAK